MGENFILGKSPLNIDGPEKLTGRAKYVIDMVLPGMVHGKVLRSPHPHAKIINIDTSKAKALTGVCAILTGEDLPVLEDLPGDRPTLAQGVVRYVGDAVAAVAAETLDIAEQALKLIEVTYEELPAVFDPEEAMKPDSKVIIHASSKGPDGEEMPPNVCHYYKARDGDVEEGFKEADFVVENRFTTGMAQCCPMEPHAALAEVDIYSNVVAWSNTQTAYSVKTKLSRLLEVPSHKVRVVVPPHIGGGFGCKTRIKCEGIAAILSRACLKPVKVVSTREEVFVDTTVKHPFVIYIKDGVNKDGTLVAREIKEILDAGAYTEGTVGAYVTRNSAYGAVGVYAVPNFKLDNYRIYTNKPVGGAFRGFGVAQTTWAVESQMDILAEMLKIEPLEFRLQNMLKDGDLNPEGYRMHAVGSRQTVLKAAEGIQWGTPSENGKNGNGSNSLARGKGIAIGCKHFSIQTSSAALRIAEDESLEIRSSVTDIGQGSRTIMAQIAAEEFKIPLEKVRMIQVDTDVTPYDTGQSGSSTTVKAGHAVRMACQETKRKLFERASEVLEASPDDLETEGGRVYVKGSPEKEIRIGQLFKRIPVNGPGFDHGPFLEEGANIMGDATFFPANETNPQGESLPLVGFSYCSQACEVEVDTETGRVKILKFVSILDPGKPLNAVLVDGQIEGGVGTGIGTALMEEMCFSNGRVTNGNLTDYRIPTSLDVPDVDNVTLDIVETDYQNGPYGAKGIGEVVLCATAAAISSAIYNATGVRIKDMPLTPERVAQALSERDSNGG